MPGEYREPQERKEIEKQVSLVVTYDGKNDPRIVETLKSRDNSTLEFINAYNMPEHPPQDLSYVYINIDPKFRDEQHKNNWKDVKFRRLTWGKDGSFHGFSSYVIE